MATTKKSLKKKASKKKSLGFPGVPKKTMHTKVIVEIFAGIAATALAAFGIHHYLTKDKAVDSADVKTSGDQSPVTNVTVSPSPSLVQQATVNLKTKLNKTVSPTLNAFTARLVALGIRRYTYLKTRSEVVHNWPLLLAVLRQIKNKEDYKMVDTIFKVADTVQPVGGKSHLSIEDKLKGTFGTSHGNDILNEYIRIGVKDKSGNSLSGVDEEKDAGTIAITRVPVIALSQNNKEQYAFTAGLTIGVLVDKHYDANGLEISAVRTDKGGILFIDSESLIIV